LLGITVACARCHDHKYDAVPTEDYYSLYGVFASCTEPAELPLISSPFADKSYKQSEAYRKYEDQLAKLKDEVEKFKTTKHTEFLDQSRHQSADYLAKVAAGDGDGLAAKLSFMSLDPKDLRPRLVERWRQFVAEHAKVNDPVWGLWHELLKLRTSEFSEKAPAVVADYCHKRPSGILAGECNPLVKAAFDSDTVAAPMDVARIYGNLLTDIYERWKSSGGNEDAFVKLSDDTRQLAEVLVSGTSPTSVDRDDVRQFLNRADRNKYQELQKKVDSHIANSVFAPSARTASMRCPTATSSPRRSPRPRLPRCTCRASPRRSCCGARRWPASCGCPTSSPPAPRSCRRSAIPTRPSWCAPRLAASLLPSRRC
jgi:hypothetical protein